LPSGSDLNVACAWRGGDLTTTTTTNDDDDGKRRRQTTTTDDDGILGDCRSGEKR
jgi:hypothetical protein